MKTYTNKKLAEDYYKIHIYSSPSGGTSYHFMRKKIKVLDIDLAEFYEQNKSLKNLKVDGIGPKTKRALELILSKGVKEAIRELELDKMERIRIPGRLRTRKSPEEQSPSFDNVTRAYELD